MRSLTVLLLTLFSSAALGVAGDTSGALLSAALAAGVFVGGGPTAAASTTDVLGDVAHGRGARCSVFTHAVIARSPAGHA